MGNFGIGPQEIGQDKQIKSLPCAARACAFAQGSRAKQTQALENNDVPTGE